MSNLAIIIPAYKDAFLGNALESLANQTCKDFTVYIGDDASPQSIELVVAKYKHRLNLVYHRFEENMGGTDLVGQWERCIALSNAEPWIWLFSDDDELEPRCVECFYKEIKIGNHYDLYHFDVDLINESGEIFVRRHQFPEWLSSKEFITKKLKGEIASYVVEYVFSRRRYEECHGFQNFDLAWGSDDATWVKFGLERGIKTITGAKVRWRKSEVNISPNNNDPIIVVRKLESDIEFLHWTNSFFSVKNESNRKLIRSEFTWFCTNVAKYRHVLGKQRSQYYMKRMCSEINMSYLYYLARVYTAIK